ncbi:MAG: hypothetical protein RLZZ237_1932 [Pseudomonadota bacterium]
MRLKSCNIKQLGAALLLASCHLTAQADQAVETVESFRVKMADKVMQNCMRSTTEPALQAYMEKANTEGAHFTNHAQTLAYLETRPEWTSRIFPHIKNICACLVGPGIAEILNAKSGDELEATMLGMKEKIHKQGADKAYMASCMQAHAQEEK